MAVVPASRVPRPVAAALVAPPCFFLWLWAVDWARSQLWGPSLAAAPLRGPALALFLSVLLGLSLGLVGWGLVRLAAANPLRDPSETLGQTLGRRLFEPAGPAQLGRVGALFGVSLVGLCLAYPAFAIARSLIISFAQPHFAALAIMGALGLLGLVGVAVTPAATAVGVRGARALSAIPVLGQVFSRLGVALVCLAGLGSLLAALVVWTYWKPFSYLPWEAIASTALSLCLTLVSVLLLTRLSRLARIGILIPLAAAFLGAALLSLGAGPQGGGGAASLARSFSLGAQLGYRVADASLDFDGDGHIHVLGGGDCAPFDPSRYPGAADVPDNGVDEDCDGADLALAQLDRDVHSSWPVPKSVPKKPPVVLITIDAFAAQRLAALGETRGITPHLDAFSKKAAVFRHCFSQGPSTRLSFPSIFTSRWDSQIGRKLTGRHPYPIDEKEVMLAEVMRASGYDTAAVLPNAYFGRGRWRSITSGFRTVVDKPFVEAPAGGHNSSLVTDAALAQLDAPRKKPPFLWVHYYDAHSPHVAPKDLPALGKRKQDIYDAELKLVDREVGRLLDGIQARLGDKALIVVSADHGIAFDAPRHKKLNYGYDLNTITLHVPLLIRAPFIQPRVLDGVVSTMDIAPTVANLVRARGRRPFEGASLLPELLDGKATRPARLVHQFYIMERRWKGEDPLEVMSLRTDRHNLIHDRRDGTYQLYDWRKDYLETQNLSYEPAHARTLQALQQQLALYTFKLHDGGRPKPPAADALKR